MDDERSLSVLLLQLFRRTKEERNRGRSFLVENVAGEDRRQNRPLFTGRLPCEPLRPMNRLRPTHADQNQSPPPTPLEQNPFQGRLLPRATDATSLVVFLLSSGLLRLRLTRSMNG
ncbi:hypothetical protein RJT34_20349 [Clitoria ternatea]|uniref:Uncharacterized protein n=1 Tax=Clitoria ternatea TaxID=43366 RepID=A0AAN9P4U3_CLITE